jgi:dienelactone hydrolase
MHTRSLHFSGDGGAVLAGELVLPDGEGPWPGVVLLHGAGHGERKHQRVIADVFAEHGLASLVFDRRGNGESQGAPGMDLVQLGRDAAAAHAALCARPEIDDARAGLWGYSNGAWVATIAASDVGPAFLVLVGAAGVSPARAEAYRRAEDVRRQGVAPATVAAVERAWTLLFDFMATGARPAGFDGELERTASAIQSDEDLDRIEVPAFVRENPHLDSVPRFDRPPLNGPLDGLAATMPDMAYDPIPGVRALGCPTLVVLAEHDANVPPEESGRRFEEVAAARPDVTVEVLAGAQHTFAVRPISERNNTELLQRPLTRDEYDPRLFEVMVQWLRGAGLTP